LGSYATKKGEGLLDPRSGSANCEARTDRCELASGPLPRLGRFLDHEATAGPALTVPGSPKIKKEKINY